MRLAFVTPRFLAADATPPELLAAELARRAPDHWRTTVLSTTAGESPSKEPFREGQTQEEGVRLRRFPALPPEAAGSGGPSSPGLLRHLAERRGDYDLIVLFGSLPPLCREVVRIDPGRTVLLPFADDEAADPALAEVFDLPAAFIFGSEAEEVLVLKRYGGHRRMRETVTGDVMLPRAADGAAFRRRAGIAGPYLVLAGPPEPGRGVEEFLRFFCTFKDRHRDEALDLVLFGPASISIPQRPDLRVLGSRSARERLDAIAGALVVVVPARLAGFAAAATEPFSLGVPILVNASATRLVDDCKASNGGLYYQNYDELELILELGARDPRLFGRMGAAGREFLAARNDWDALMSSYDRAFRSFARPPRASRQATPADREPENREEPGAADPQAVLEPETPDQRAAKGTPAASSEPAPADEAPDGADTAGEDPGPPPPEAGTPDGSLPSFFKSSIRD